MIVIKVRKNGSLKVEGDDVQLLDWDGNEYPIDRRPFALCRCGASTRKPFCDGTHRAIGFIADDPALPGGGDRPADPVSPKEL